MCSRECYSVSLGGLIAGLLIFLGAFLIGVAAVKMIVTSFLPESDMAAIQNCLKPISVKRHTPRQDIEPLALEYDGVVTGAVQHLSSEERFRLTNLGSEPVYFALNDKGQTTVYISNAGGLHLALPFTVPVHELNPGDSTYGSAWIPNDAENYDCLSIDYSVGDRRVQRRSSPFSFEDSY